MGSKASRRLLEEESLPESMNIDAAEATIRVQQMAIIHPWPVLGIRRVRRDGETVLRAFVVIAFTCRGCALGAACLLKYGFKEWGDLKGSSHATHCKQEAAKSLRPLFFLRKRGPSSTPVLLRSG